MEARDIIDRLAERREVEAIIRKMKCSIGEQQVNLNDLAQDIYMWLMTKPAKVIEGLNDRGELNYYIVRMVQNQIASQTSTYFKRYKKMKTEELDDTRF